jgi:enoyl-[acyl-carrier protein] reductase I
MAPRVFSTTTRTFSEVFMGFLADKKILLTGLLSNRSIAYGIAASALREGATLAYTYVGDKFKDRVEGLVQELGGGGLVMPCDVTSDEQIDGVFATLGKEWGALDGIVHAIAYAPAEALKGDFLEGVSREAFRISHDVSSYSLAALAKGGRSLMQGRKGAIVTLTYLGAERSVTNYNLMGLAKASLEANVRYLAACLGPEGTRVNGVSAGPIKTLAAAGIAGFSKILHHVSANAPLRRNVTTSEVGDATAFLLSDLASAITGEVLHVDCGYSTVAVGLGAE